VIALWHDLGSITTPTLLVPVAASLLGRGLVPGRWMLANMAVPLATTVAWVAWKNLLPAHVYPGGVEPIYAGLAVALATWLLGRFVTRGRTMRAPADAVPTPIDSGGSR
jgi:hypothetical protein